MGKPYWGYNNFLMQSGMTFSARTQDTAYPVSNLGKHRLWPGYRSADKALSLNGTDEYAYVADHADFDITGDFTVEALIYLFSSGTGTNRRVISKIDGSSGNMFFIDSSNRVAVYINGTSLDADTALVTTIATLSADTWYRIKVVYDASSQEVSVYINGLETARVNNSTQTGGSLSGTIPSSITANSINVVIGANHAGTGGLFAGYLAFVGIADTEFDYGTYLSPSQCAAYYDFDDSDLSDSSGNDHTLTGVGIDSSNYFDCAAYQYVGYIFSSKLQPTCLFIDRRHNLTSNAVVKWYGAYWQSSANLDLLATINVTAGQPVVSSISAPTARYYFWLEVNDPENPDGYIDLPYVYLGDRTSMQRAHLRGYNHGQPTLGNVIADSGGGYTGYTTSEKLWNANLRFRCNSTDFSTLQKVLDEAQQMRPVVICEDADNEATSTRLVYLPEAIKAEYQHIITNQNFVDIAMQEAGGGV